MFLLNNVHEDAPEVFQTRWTLSYLRGPLTRTQIKQLMAPLKATGVTGQASGGGEQVDLDWGPLQRPGPASHVRCCHRRFRNILFPFEGYKQAGTR